jgi:tetratricopeptide (TPR) repeat protein
MEQQKKAGIEAILRTAHEFLTQGNPVEARNLLVIAKMQAMKAELTDLVDAANKNLAVSHLDEANALYRSGQLEAAANKYPEAEHAYSKFEGSFDQETLLQHLGALYPHWVDAAFQLGQKAHVKGNELLTASNGVAESVMNGLGSFDAALRWYAMSVEIFDGAKRKGVDLKPEYITFAEQAISEIRAAATPWANSIGRPDVAKKYLNLE